MAHFEIFILNYNGAHFLPECLESLRALERGSNTYHVNVVDNASQDRSSEVVYEHFPEVNYIALEKNHGFSKGNNLGVKKRSKELKQQGKRADIIVFLNNDTVVDKQWLLAAACAFQRRSDVGIVGSKSLFYDHFCVISLRTSDTYCPADHGESDTRTLGVFLHHPFSGENVFSSLPRSRLIDSYGVETNGCWFSQEGKLYAAVCDSTKRAKIELVFEHHNPKTETIDIEFGLNGEPSCFQKLNVSRNMPQRLSLALNLSNFVDVIQNAGSYVRRDWEAGDRGFLEIDRGQFDSEQEVDSICGVSMFIREELYQRLGGFDENYFAYFEDTDLSLRARLLGWKCLYVPESRLRHVHCGSGIEHSDYFNANVAYSHLVFSSKLMPRSEWREKLCSCYRSAGEQFEAFQSDRIIEHKPQLRAMCRYFKRYPRFVANRCFQFRHHPHRSLF